MGKHLEQGSSLLDLGTENPFTPFLKEAATLFKIHRVKIWTMHLKLRENEGRLCDCF